MVDKIRTKSIRTLRRKKNIANTFIHLRTRDNIIIPIRFIDSPSNYKKLMKMTSGISDLTWVFLLDLRIRDSDLKNVVLWAMHIKVWHLKNRYSAIIQKDAFNAVMHFNEIIK